MRRLLALRSARLFVLSSTISSLGDFALWLAMGIWVKSMTGSSGAAGLVFFFYTAGALTSPLSGVVVDRVRRKRLMIVVNLLTTLLLAALLPVRGRDEVWLIYLVMFLYGVAGSIAGSASAALLPDLVEDELLGEANSVLQTTREGLRLITPIIGAGVYAWVGAHVVVLVDAGTFVVATALLLAMRGADPRPHRDPDAAPGRWWHEATAGVRFVLHATVLRQLVLTISVALLAVGFFETIVFSIVTQGLHHSATFVGPLEVVQGAGAIVGGLSAAALLRRFGGGYLVAAALLVIGLMCPVLALSDEPLVMTAVGLLGASLPVLTVGFTTTLQRRTPSRLLGRVNGACDVLMTGPQTVSIALGAMLVTVVRYQDLLYAMGVVIVCCGIYLVTRPEQRLEPAATADGSAGQPAVAAVLAGDGAPVARLVTAPGTAVDSGIASTAPSDAPDPARIDRAGGAVGGR